MTFVVGYSSYSGNKGSESVVSNSLKVTPIVSGDVRIKARSVRPQTRVVSIYNI